MLAFETALATIVTTPSSDQVEDRRSTICSDGERAFWIGQAKLDEDLGKRKKGGATVPTLIGGRNVSLPMFASTMEAFYVIDDDGSVYARPRGAIDEAYFHAPTPEMWLERVLRELCDRSWPISWTAGAEAAPKEAPNAFATGHGVTWWDEGGWFARLVEADGSLKAWFHDVASAEHFFATPRPRGRLRSSVKFAMPEGAAHANLDTAPMLRNELDDHLSMSLTNELRAQKARFEAERDDVPPTLASLLEKRRLAMHAGGQMIEVHFAGLRFKVGERTITVGVKAILLESARVPWPDDQKTPRAGKAPVLPFAMDDADDGTSYWVAADGTIYGYDDFTMQMRKRAPSFETWLDGLLFPKAKAKPSAKKSSKSAEKA